MDNLIQNVEVNGTDYSDSARGAYDGRFKLGLVANGGKPVRVTIIPDVNGQFSNTGLDAEGNTLTVDVKGNALPATIRTAVELARHKASELKVPFMKADGTTPSGVTKGGVYTNSRYAGKEANLQMFAWHSRGSTHSSPKLYICMQLPKGVGNTSVKNVVTDITF